MTPSGSLFDRVATFDALLAAAQRARRARPAASETVSFFIDLESNLIDLRDELRSERYNPRPLRRFTIFEPKRRVIAAAAFRDRVVHHALCAVLEPIFERSLTPHTFACRRGRGVHSAVRTAQHHLRRRSHVLKTDVRHYFETIDLGLLRLTIARRVPDRRVLDMIDRILENGLANRSADPPVGLPIGNLTSQHFANLFLSALDQWVLRRIKGAGYVRYMDDMLVFGDEPATLWTLEHDMAEYLATRLRLELKREISAVYKQTIGVPFLGMRIFRGTVRLTADSKKRLARKLRAAERALLAGRIDDSVYQARVAGLLGHATAADTLALRRSVLSRR